MKYSVIYFVIKKERINTVPLLSSRLDVQIISPPKDLTIFLAIASPKPNPESGRSVLDSSS